MEQIKDGIVKIDFDDMFWEIHVRDTGETEGGKHRPKESIIELSWGWTAGMSDEEIKNLADDSPTGHHSIRILSSQAERLKDKLTEAIDKLNEQNT